MYSCMPRGQGTAGAYMSSPIERGELNGFHVVDPDLYDRYRAEVLALTNSYQVDINEFLPNDGTRKRGLSDAEIADRLGLDIRDVTEIRGSFQGCCSSLVPRGWSEESLQGRSATDEAMKPGPDPGQISRTHL